MRKTSRLETHLHSLDNKTASGFESAQQEVSPEPLSPPYEPVLKSSNPVNQLPASKGTPKRPGSGRVTGGNISNARLNSVPCTNVFLTENILEKLLSSRDNAFTSIGTAGTSGATSKEKRRGMHLFSAGKSSQTNNSGVGSTLSGLLGLGREVRPHTTKKKHKNLYEKKLHG